MSKSQGSGTKSVQSTASVEAAHPLTLEVLEGPMDGARLVGSFERVRVGRSASNDLALALDRSVSGEHAVLTWNGSAWVLEDRRSTNGTWLAGGRLNESEALPREGLFVAGHAVIRATWEITGETFLPTAETLRGEVQRLRDRLAPSAARGWGAAVALAISEGSLFVTDRHLLRGLAMTGAELLPGQGTVGKALRHLVAETLRGTARYTGERAWVGQILQAAAWSGEVFLEADVAPTPRLLAALTAADAHATAAGFDTIEATDLLEALWREESRVRQAAEAEGIDATAVLTHLEANAPDRAPTAAEPAPAVEPGRPPRRTSSGDPVVDRRARESARKLYGMAALYQLAPPEERQHALKQLLGREVAELPAGQRSLLLEQLQRLFPVSVGSAQEAAEMGRLRRRIAQLESAAVSAAASPEQSRAVMPAVWRAVLGDDKAPAVELEGPDGAALEVVADVFSFATSLENFIVGTVHNLTTQGAGTDIVHLPGYRTSIRRMARKVLAGEPVRREDLQEYLEAVERWLLVVTAAYHEGPRVWFEEFWAKVNPTAVEAKLSDAGWKRKLGVESIEFWNYYKEMVHAVSPDLVTDEILRVVRRRAEEHYARLREGRRPS